MVLGGVFGRLSSTALRGVFVGGSRLLQRTAPSAVSLCLPALTLMPVRGKKTAGAAATKNRPANRRRKSMGFKKSGGQFCRTNDVLILQRGTKFHPGLNVVMGRDHTIHAACDGFLKFNENLMRGRTRGSRWRSFISVEPLGSDGNEVGRWHAKQTAVYHEVLKRKRAELKGRKYYERVPQMLRRLAKAKLVEQGQEPRLEGNWKALLWTKPRSPEKVERLEERAKILNLYPGRGVRPTYGFKGCVDA